MVKAKQFLNKSLIYLILLIFTVIALFPVVYIILASFKTNQEIMAGGVHIFPKQWQFQNYIKAWKLANFQKYTYNSAVSPTVKTILKKK